MAARRSKGSRVRGCFHYPRNDDEGTLLRLHSCIDLLQKPKYPGEAGLKGLDP